MKSCHNCKHKSHEKQTRGGGEPVYGLPGTPRNWRPRQMQYNMIRMKVRNGQSDEKIIADIINQFQCKAVDINFITNSIAEWREFFEEVQK